jgi:thymidine kinase
MPRLREFCIAMAARGKMVIVAALDADYKQQPFAEICLLVAQAEHVEKLSSICFACHGNAYFSRRINAESTTLQLIGGADKYVASCRGCFTIPISPEHLHRIRDNAKRLELMTL